MQVLAARMAEILVYSRPGILIRRPRDLFLLLQWHATIVLFARSLPDNGFRWHGDQRAARQRGIYRFTVLHWLLIARHGMLV